MSIVARLSTARGAAFAGLFLTLCTPHSACALQIDEARHLLTRTGFGAAPHEIAALEPLSREQAVDRLLDGMTLGLSNPPPAFVRNVPRTTYLRRLGDYVPPSMAGVVVEPLTGEQATDDTHLGMKEMAQLRVWWLDQMISTPSPLTERLGLFWQGHFTSKYFDVEAPKLMYDQLQKIRTLGTQNFAALLAAMMRDPAMLIFLDNAVSTRQVPNENFARELLELFTLGVGHYEQRDIKAFARILAGHSVDFGGSWQYVIRPEQLDTGVKTFLGRTGAWSLEDAERILLAQPRTAQFISEKFYREFIGPDPNPAAVERFAAVLRSQDYAMRPFLRALFLSDEFWSDANRAQLVKSPVELLVGFVRTFDVPSPDVEALNTYATLLGQELFEPPTVQGWKGGMNWLNAQTVGARSEMLDLLWRGRSAGIEYLNAGPNDLIVRYSAEEQRGKPTQLRVRIDGVEVAHASPRWPSDTGDQQSQFRPKPAWDIVVVPRSQLPHEIHTVEIVFDKPVGTQSNAFINWIQLDGKRLPSYLATVKFDPHQNCSEGQIPRGMLYCSANVVFDLRQIAARQGDQEPTLFDRAEGHVNSVIECSTARVRLTMQPAARTAELMREPIARQWQAAIGDDTDSRLLLSAITALPPLQASVAVRGTDERSLRALTLDPVYNLK